MALVRATGLLFFLQLRRALSLRSTRFALLLAVLPVLLAVAVLWIARESELSAPPVLPFAWLVLVRGVVPLTALLVGAGLVAEEIDDRTISYLFVRPFPRAALLLGRWLGAAVILTVLLGLSSLAVFALLEQAAGGDPDLLVPAELQRRTLVAIVLGGLTYSALFAALGTWLRHPVLVGGGYVFAFEGLLGSLPGEGQALTVQYYLKSLLVAGDEEVRAFVELIPEALASVDLVPAGEALETLGWIVGIALGLGSLVLSRRQIVLPA